MDTLPPTIARTIGAIAWLALALQLYLVIDIAMRGGQSVGPVLVRYFSYFTILTNLLVALCLTLQIVAPASRWGRFFSQPGTQAAIVSYIAFVCIAYNVLLRHIWNPRGLSMVADELLHDVVPIAFIVYWTLCAPKDGITVRKVPGWLIYPLAYVAWVLVRGAVVNEYPYHFIDVGALGYPTTLLHVAGLIVAFLFLGAAIVALATRLPRGAAPGDSSPPLRG